MVGIPLFRVNRIFLLLFPLFLTVTPRAEPSAENPITIEVGTLSAEDGDGWILSQIRSFEEAHPHIRIRHFALGLPSRDEVRIEDLPELALNVVGVRSDLGYEVGYLVDRDLLVPIESFLPDPDFAFEDFFPNVWDYVTYEGRRWGVPYLCSSVVLIADWEVFRNAGVQAPPKTWEEFLTVLPALTKDTDGDGAVDQWGFRLGMRGRHDTHLFYLWMTKVLQDGGYVMKEGRFELTHPSLRRAYEFFDRVQKSPGAREDNRRFKDTAGDLDYRYGLQIAPSYFLNPLMKQHNYRIVPWVTSGKKAIHDERRHYLCIRRSTPEKEKASWDFLKWIVRPGADHPDGAWTFHLSARKDLLERKEVRHKIGLWAQGFDTMHETKGWNVHHGNQVPGRFEAMERLEEIVTSLFHGEWTFEEAMDKAEKECNAILAEYRRPETISVDSPEAEAQLDKANQLENRRDYKKASLEYLDFWSGHPGLVEGKGIRVRILSCLRNAGYHAEAETMATSHRPEFIARLLHQAVASDGSSSVAEFRPASVDASEFDRPISISQLVYSARIAAVSSFEGKPTLSRLEDFYNLCSRLTLEDPNPGEEWGLLAIYHQGLIDLILRLRAHGERSRSLIGDYALDTVTAKEYARRIEAISTEIACAAARADSDRIPLVFNALDTRIERGKEIEDWNEVVAAYREVLERFPEADEAPWYSLDLSLLLKEEAQDLDAALGVCLEIEDRYPENEVSRIAEMNRAVWLYEAGRFDEAKPLFEAIGRSHGPEREAGILLSLLCDYVLGDKKEAERAIEEFVFRCPDTDLGRRAGLWLVSNRVADFQFLEANRTIQAIAEGVSIGSSTSVLQTLATRLLAPRY
jgi:ABC-type glycerol-3-phosphate transport system substrate-binding protein